MNLFNWEWVARNWSSILERTWEHVFLDRGGRGGGDGNRHLGLSLVAVRRRHWYGPIRSTNGDRPA